ncbi:MAG: DUF1440 domain-containing protein [Chitinophagaceae bacterium]|nr:DUF1440 domain-containing protein [Chitinophagaceae bacterium]
MTKQYGSYWRSPGKTILLAGFVAGTLDLLGAILVYAVILKKIAAEKLVRGIASGIFKTRAFSGGPEMVICGIAIHYVIAFAFTVFYFLIFPYIPFFRKQKIIGGLLYGIFIWVIMNMIVLPLVFPNRPPVTLTSFLQGAPILMIMIGLPLSYFTNKYYAVKRR